MIGGTSLFLAVLLSIFTVTGPYHLDTTAYFNSLNDLREGHLTCGYATRCMVSYFLIPFAIAGAHAVKAGFIFAALAFFLFSYLFISRTFTRHTGYLASLLLLFTPAGLITVTHLKEDFVGLMFLSLALLLATFSRARWRLLSPVCFAFCLLSKESSILFAPFFLSIHGFYLFLEPQRPNQPALSARMKWTLMSASAVIPIAVTAVIKHGYLRELALLGRSPYLGQFKGPFSHLLPVGFGLYRRGFGFAPLFWLQLLGFGLLFLEKDSRKRVLSGIFVANAVLVALFSMNNTVMTYRNFVIVGFLTLPPAIRFLEIVIPRRWLLYVTSTIVAIVTLAKSYAYVDFHSSYNTQAKFLDGLRGRLLSNPVILTMDYAGLIKHYLASPTRQHLPDSDDTQAKSFVDALASDPANSYYLFPDAISYDEKGTIRTRLQQSFQFESVQNAWFEDYHTMDYGYSPGELSSVLEKQTGCRASYALDGRTSIGEIEMDLYRYKLACGDKAKEIRDSQYPGYRGTVFPSLIKAQVFRLIPQAH